MAQPRVFIDGHVGTTGLRVREWLAARGDLDVASLREDQRKDAAARREELNRADVAILCLPDDAAREAVAWLDNPDTRIIDASTAHRVDPDWVYGLTELSSVQGQAIAASKRVSNPGCWPVTVVLGLRPLIEDGLLAADAPVSVHGISGYSGGGRQMIERWEDPASGLLNHVYPAPYALDRVHKHMPEMTQYSGLAHTPQFSPSVGPFRCGMRVCVPLHEQSLAGGATGKAVWESLHQRYKDAPFVRVQPLREPLASDERSFDPRACNDTNRVDLHVLPHPDGHVQLVGVLDNLGKGACGMAIQSLNSMLGLPETEGLAQ